MFALNKQNYARYGLLYVHSLENIEETHPGCLELIQFKGLSVQGQNNYPCRTAIDQRGEQTINRDAKVSGGIKYFASASNSILKWTLNRAAQARNTEALYDLADVKRIDDIYKHNRPSVIIKSEKSIAKLHKVITEEYLNPFDPNMDASQLYNVSSGMPIEAEVSESILAVRKKGEKIYEEFVDERIRSTKTKIHEVIKRKKLILFRNIEKKVVLKVHSKHRLIEANRNVLGKLLALTAKSEKNIDFEQALKYPLHSLPLCIAFPDGARRTTPKSKFMEVILLCSNGPTYPKEVHLPEKTTTTYLVDLMALIRTMHGLFDTYHDLAMKLLICYQSGIVVLTLWQILIEIIL